MSTLSVNELPTSQPMSSSTIMNAVLIALVPGFLAQLFFFGLGYLSNLCIALLCGVLTLGFIAQISSFEAQKLFKDSANWITCALIAIALPPNMSIWLVLVAVSAGLGLGKYAYGGIGQNIFNPAMVGYAVVLISYPAELAVWPALLDSVTGATPLEQLKYSAGISFAELISGPGFGWLGGYAWEWINLGYFAGGLYLIYRRVINWQIPLSMMGALVLLSTIWYDMGSSMSLGSPMMHLFSGGIMLGVFFIATDPVTCPASKRGKIYFGLLSGALVFIIRSWGAYPDGIAFAILLANLCTPLIDQLETHNV